MPASSVAAVTAASPLPRLLEQLVGARETGNGRWLARCPAHEDSRPSLSLRELADGRVLIHCFAGCGAEDVLEAMGLDWRSLFPDERPAGHAWPPASRRARRLTGEETLAVLDLETLAVAGIASRLAGGGELLESDLPVLVTASRRIAAVRELMS